MPVISRKVFAILSIVVILSMLFPLFAVQPAQAAGTFVKGINMNGNAVTIDGNAWLSYADAKTSGFSTTATKTFSSNITWSPAVDSATNTMLNTVIYQSGSGFTMTQTIANGTYQVYFWLTENYANNARSVNIKLEGNTVASGVGGMNKNTWARYGPYTATVSDGALSMEFVRVSGDPQVAGLAIFSSNSGTPTATFTPTNKPTSTNTPAITNIPTITSTPTNTPTATVTQLPSTTAFAVNAGGSMFNASDGTAFAADNGYSGGSTYSNTAAIAGTTDDTLFNTERYGNFTYTKAVANGLYRVNLYFAETYQTQSGKRVFDVLMEGTEVISNLDIYAQAGANTAYVTDTLVTVSDGALNLQFVTNIDNAKVNAIKVTSAGPSANFTFSPAMPVTAQTVSFNGSTSSYPSNTIASYAWNFGDGGTATGATTTHTFATANTYAVTLTVTGSDGKTGSVTRPVVVSTGNPVASFTISPSTVKPGNTVTVNASASSDPDGTITSYAWNFGDGSTGTGVTATHVYPVAGNYTITLTVTDNSGKTGSVAKPISVRETTNLKPRLVVLTDVTLNTDPDDHESLIRLLAHADMYEIEGLILTTGFSIDTLNNSTNSGYISLIQDAINAYEQDLPNLMKRSNQVGFLADESKQEVGYWPSAQYLRNRTMTGSRNRGVSFLGSANDSPGSNLIVQLVDENDDRPLYVAVWGGGNTVAQSIWKVKQNRSAAELKAFLHKLRVYAITDQDRAWPGAPGAVGSQGFDYSSHQWMRGVSPGDLLFIWDECAWRYQNDHGAANWSQYSTHIQAHGNLGRQYPTYKWGVEGDTPSFLYVMPTGLNNPDFPNQASWGGTFYNAGNNLWKSDYQTNPCETYNNRFYPASFNNFAARMDWAQSGSGNRNPIIVLDGDNGISVLTKTPKQGTSIILDASQTSDPDGNNLTYIWWIQSDAGTYTGTVSITNSSSPIATINIPSNSAGKTFHVILEVKDNGTHNLSDYRRIIFAPTN